MAALLDVLLARGATRIWQIGLAGLLTLSVLLHASAWLGIPTVATPDTNAYCEILHQLEAGVLPDLRDRHIGYPLFLYLCKLLPLPLNATLPFVQHLLELVASVMVMTWVRRQWGVAAGLLAGALLLANSGRAIWLQYAHPNALLISLVPIACITLLGWLTRRSFWLLLASALLWFFIMLNRDEVLMIAGVIPVAMYFCCRSCRRACLQWLGTVAAITAIGIGGRTWYNRIATGDAAYSTHAINIIAWRGLHSDELVAPPRPEKLERLYQVALADGAQYRCRHHLHYEDLWRAASNHWGMSQREAIDYMAVCALECIQRRPMTYVRVVLRDSVSLWLHPRPNLEWEAVRLSDPGRFGADASGLYWASDALAEFPLSYDSSAAQRLFSTLAVVRPGETFAMKPLAICFLVGAFCLAVGIGVDRKDPRRGWILGLACSVLFMTLFYAATIDIPHRFRVSVEWAFFVVASLGVVLPMRAWRGYPRLEQPDGVAA